MMTRHDALAREAVHDRTAEMREHDTETWAAWQDIPFEVWPDAALVSYLAGTAWQSAFDGCQPTGTELRAIIAEAIGPFYVIPSKRGPE